MTGGDRQPTAAQRLRALLALVLLAGGSLMAGLAPAAAQSSPVICFDGEGFAGACDPSAPAIYMQGDSVSIVIGGAPPGSQVDVAVRCVTGCPSTDRSATAVYHATFDGTEAVVFPRDFMEPGGGNAVADKAPRYNSTWEVSTTFGGAPLQRRFQVWLVDPRHGTNESVRPGEVRYLRATGFDPGAVLSYRMERRDETGRYVTFYAPRAQSYTGGAKVGWFEDAFSFDKREAESILACGRETADCYRVVLSGLGKSEEVVPLRVDVAQITRNLDTTPRPGGIAQLQRTQNATYLIDLRYPGGSRHLGPQLVPDDVHDSLTFGGKALRVAVEKVYNGNGSAYLVDEVPARFDAGASGWRATWTIPMDLVVDPTVRYRLRVAEQLDRYGNRIPSEVLGEFTVQAAALRPLVDVPFDQLERTREGIVRVHVLYHNGTPFTPFEAMPGNASPLRGCFARVPTPPPEPAPPTQPEVPTCAGRDPVYGAYYDGAWNFSVKYPREHEDLVEYRFILANGTEDRFGNDILDAVGGSYVVTVARPEIVLSTVARGRETDTFERGDRVYVSADIRYHDGSAYNHSVRVNPDQAESRVLSGLLVRRGPAPPGQAYGPVASEEPFNLTEIDAYTGRWSGFLQLTDDDSLTPAGNWTFRFEIRDNLTTPNVNLTSIDREVVVATIQLCPTFQPPSRASTGTSVKFRFQLFYSECGSGREVPATAMNGLVTARVMRFSPFNQTAFGAPVSGALLPTYSAETRDWGLEYEIPDELYQGTFAIRVEGADSFGNRVVRNAVSRSFVTYTEIMDRSVQSQPSVEVARGESATVVFDAREGDTGLSVSRLPTIALERFDTSSTECARAAELGGCWVRERADLRVNDSTLTDHVGVLPVGVDMPTGLYRFRLEGRDARFRVFTAFSDNFTILPTTITRALATSPPERIVKGEAFTFYIELAAGDKVRERAIYFNGRLTDLPPPTLTYEPGRLNVTYAVPFDAPNGNYTMRMTGRDVYGNTILVDTPPFEAAPASLMGRILGQPPRTLERGESTRVLFGITYPTGVFYTAADLPRVSVIGPAGKVTDARVSREGLTFAASWTPSPTTALGEYWFEVTGDSTGVTGNAFPALRSQAFRLVPGTVTRAPVNDVVADIERMDTATLTVPFDGDDKFAGFELVYYGPSLVVAIDPTRPLVEVTRTPLVHTIDTAARKYVAAFPTDQQTQTGTYRIVMTGQDGNGNDLVSESRPFVIRPTAIGVSFGRPPPLDALGEGKTITFDFTLRYRLGAMLDESLGRPSVVMLYNGFPISQRPEVEFRDGIWYAAWTAPPTLPDGEYMLVVGGSDSFGNAITSTRSAGYPLSSDLGESFAKSIPGPSPLLVLVALAGLAALVGRRR